MKTMPEVPNKLFYKIGEVCELTDTQPYVLRFWESEFPQLAPRKNRSGQRVYQRKDIDTVLRIKRLLYEEEYTIAGARKKLDEDGPAPASETAHVKPPRSAPSPARPAEPESDHPVDLLLARPDPAAGKGAPGRRAGQTAGSSADAERLARLEQAVAELRDALGTLRAMLGQD